VFGGRAMSGPSCGGDLVSRGVNLSQWIDVLGGVRNV
jgi:hypothetical protein